MTEWTKEQQAEHRKLWVEALRSGKYRQATGQLRRGSAMCCLGVACEISSLGEWDEAGDPRRPQYRIGEHADRMVLPEPVREWLGLRTLNSSFLDGDTANQLSEVNDNGGTFEALATLIESEPEGLIAPQPPTPLPMN